MRKSVWERAREIQSKREYIQSKTAKERNTVRYIEREGKRHNGKLRDIEIDSERHQEREKRYKPDHKDPFR